MKEPTGLPAWAQEYSFTQRLACIEWLATLPLAELRERQAAKAQAIRSAYLKDTAGRIIADLQERHDQIVDAIMLKLYGNPDFLS
jgi:hypothetical protein